VSEWEPATDAEVAMRDALRTDDQESYFRILSGVDLLLPVSADALAGNSPLGWGTWSTGGRTHVLAFSSSAALEACLADYTGSARRVPYTELATTWPNLEWWLAVNPGLPIEGYLPAWFVAQLSRGDLRLPTRGPGRETAAPGKVQDLHSAALAANAAATQRDDTDARPGGPTGSDSAPPSPSQGGYPLYPVSAPPVPPQQATAAAAAYPSQPGSPPAGYQRSATASPAGYPQPGSAPPLGYPTSGPPRGYPNRPASAPPAGYPDRPASARPAGYPDRPASAPPGGYSNRPAAASPGGYLDQPASGPSAEYSQRPGSASPDGYRQQPTSAPPAGQVPGSPGPPRPGQQVGPGGLPIRTPSGVMPSGLPARSPIGAGQPPAGQYPTGQRSGGQPADGQAASMQPPAAQRSAAVPSAYSSPSVPGSAPGDPGVGGAQPRGDRAGGLPVRAPMAQTPPVPEHFARDSAAPPAPTDLPRRGLVPPGDQHASRGFPQGPASPQAAAAQQAPEQSTGFGSPLPRRQATSASEQPQLTSFPAFRSPADRGGHDVPSAAVGRPTLNPPVIPGAPGSDRPGRAELPPPLEIRSAGAVPRASRPLALPLGEEPFAPANDVERELFRAAGGGSTDAFLSTLLLATVLVPVAHDSRPGSAPGEDGFAFRTEEMDGEEFLIIFTSRERLAEHYAEPVRTVSVRFHQLIRNWPDQGWSFAVNPATPVGAKYPGPQVMALASWASEAGLGAAPDGRQVAAPVPPPKPASDDAQQATVMQKTIPPEQVDYYLERGYDRVGGFVHRATEVEHLRTPAALFGALGLTYNTSPHQPDAKEAYVLRWPAYRPSLYRIPYGGQTEQALRAMDGWVIERAPFRGNGFAPGEGRDVIAEFKVDSVRLPHGAQLWRIDDDGTERMIATFDNDGPLWRRVGEQ
jgi:hypothetical protein